MESIVYRRSSTKIIDMADYMIIRIKKYHKTDKKFIVPTWEIVEKNFKNPEEAIERKHFLTDPSDFYIVIPYYS